MVALFTSRGRHSEVAWNGQLQNKRKTEINCCAVTEGGILRLRRQQAWPLPRALAENPFRALSRAPGGLAFRGV